MTNPPHSEMTLRDYVAAHAVAAIVGSVSASPESAGALVELSKARGYSTAESIVGDAFELADAFLKARNK